MATANASVTAGLTHSGRHIGGASRLDRIGARRGRPGIEPSRDFSARGLVADPGSDGRARCRAPVVGAAAARAGVRGLGEPPARKGSAPISRKSVLRCITATPWHVCAAAPS